MSMLCLGRQAGEFLLLTDSRTGEYLGRIGVLDFSHGSVRIGFDGPKYIKIYREEIAWRKPPEESTEAPSNGE